MTTTKYDLELFLKLNEEYADRPVVPKPRSLQSVGLFEQAERRARIIDTKLDIRGKRVLEIGCGRGHVSAVLARDYDCDVTGVDIVQYDDWPERVGPKVQLKVHDISTDDNSVLGKFDRAVSVAVWEHMEHPYAALEALKKLLAPAGLAYMSANLYRGPQASHRYREVYFPWPHLLFEDDVWLEFYQHLGRRPSKPAWVNKLTVAHYYQYLRQLDFQILKEWTSSTPLDEAFYQRFIDKLGRYPRYDLEQDFIHLVMMPAAASNDSGQRVN